MKKLIGFLLLVITSACDNIGVTDTEVQAVQKVLNFYGGICNRQKGFIYENDKYDTYFELEMSKSKMLEGWSQRLDIPSSNIAYLFYSNLQNEQSNYSLIKVIVNLSDGQSYEHFYDTEDLQEIEKLQPILSQVGEKIKTQDYLSIYSNFHSEVTSELNSDQLRAFCSRYDSIYGQVEMTQFQGFEIIEEKEGKNPQVHLIGFVVRDKKNTPISLLIDRANRKIVNLDFKL